MGDYGNGSGGGMMGYSGGGGGMMGNFGAGMTGGMIVWSILALILLVAVIVAIVFVIVHLARRTPASYGALAAGPVGGEPSPVDILRRRFASGEIDDEEFKRRLAAVK